MSVDLPVSPKFLHHVLHLFTLLLCSWLGVTTLGRVLGHIHLSKLLEGEGPAMEARPKTNSSDLWVNL